MEYQVLKPEFVDLFSERERQVARERLLQYGMRKEDLPR